MQVPRRNLKSSLSLSQALKNIAHFVINKACALHHSLTNRCNKYFKSASLRQVFFIIFLFTLLFSLTLTFIPESETRSPGYPNEKITGYDGYSKDSRQPVLFMAIATSVETSGLMAALAGAFQKETGIRIKWLTVGTGSAIQYARRGNVDAVITHDQDLEEKLIHDGYGVKRVVFARNYFIICGPEEDPAGLSKLTDPATAFRKIKTSGAIFFSRGDRSGTHLKELALWAEAGGLPENKYHETGQGMAQTLLIAAAKRGYTLSDSATFSSLSRLLNARQFKPLFIDPAKLENCYSVISVNKRRHPHVRYQEALRFEQFVVSPAGQNVIAGVKSKDGQVLFEPITATEKK